MLFLAYIVIAILIGVIYYLSRKFEAHTDILNKMIELNRAEIEANKEKIHLNEKKISSNEQGVKKNKKTLELNQEILEKMK